MWGYVNCQECGATVKRDDALAHACDPERRVEFQFARLRPGVVALEQEFSRWLATRAGRFESYYAETHRP